MLAALVAVSIPWIIEWLLRRRRRRIELPTIRFLLSAAQQHRVRLQDVILLVVRSSVILVLVLALTRPILRPDPDASGLARGEKTLHVVLLFDRTYSNAQKAGSDTALSLARKIGSEVIAGLPRGSRVTVASLSDDVEVELGSSDDLPAARERVERLEVSHRAGWIVDALEWAEAFTASRQIAPAEIYILSDMQESTWSRPPDDRRDPRAGLRRLCAKHRVFCADTAAASPTNYYLTRFEPLEPVMAAGIPATLTATVEAANLQPDRTHRAELTFYVGGQKRSTQHFVVGAKPHQATFEHTFGRGGTHLLQVVLRGDDHTMDNVRSYAATVVATLAYLLLQQKDTFGLVLFDEKVHTVLPPKGSGVHFRNVIDVLSGTTGGGKTSISGALMTLAGQLKRRGLVVIVSDLVAETGQLGPGLGQMSFLGQDVILFHVEDPVERDFPFAGQTIFLGPEAEGQLPCEPRDLRNAYLAERRRHLESIRQLCLRFGYEFEDMPTDARLDVILTGFLSLRQARRRR